MLFRQTHRGGAGRQGVAASELVIVASVFLFILLVSTDFARLYYDYITVSGCARNGALYGCLDATHSTDTTGIQTAALTDAGTMSSTPSVSSTTGNDANGDPYVKVTVTSTFTTIVTYPGIPSTVTLTRSVQMRVVQTTPTP
jgi:Flp pilus assembly protein TadG